MGVGEGCQGVAIDDKALLLVSSVVCSPRAYVCVLSGLRRSSRVKHPKKLTRTTSVSNHPFESVLNPLPSFV